MNSKARKTLACVFETPAPANIKWSDIERMLVAVGAEVGERSGPRIVVDLNDVTAVFHRPHPRPEASRPVVRSVTRFLEQAGVTP